MEQVGITVIGAGVVGLAVAKELCQDYKDVFVIERNLSFGQETSSRNSEVAHAGLYYPGGSLKAKTCIEGRRLLYEFCQNKAVAYKEIGKLIVAIGKDELGDLEALYKKGLANGVGDLRLLTKADIKKIEPNLKCEAAVFSPSTGILDSHGFMKNLVSELEDRGARIVYNNEVVALEKIKQGFKVYVEDKREGGVTFFSRAVINCAGLSSDRIAQMLGLTQADYKLKYCKGEYFRVNNGKAKFIHRLIYPVPKEDRAGLGIHATLDLAGGLRLGPDDEYVDTLNYDIDDSRRGIFYESVRDFLPFIQSEDLTPDMVGIRPKLQGPEEGFRDFLIKDEAENGLAGLINLIGIESPGLTASLSIAKLVKGLLPDDS